MIAPEPLLFHAGHMLDLLQGATDAKAWARQGEVQASGGGVKRWGVVSRE